MPYLTKHEISRGLLQHLDNFREKYPDTEWVSISLQGSQNYNLATENSDLDTKIIVLPSFNDFLFNRKPISTTLINEDNSHTDVKDARLMFECFRKQNINFLEILFTPYFIVNHKYEGIYRILRENAEYIAHYNDFAFLNCVAGMSLEKLHALEHPYPAAKEDLAKYSYSPKQLHHIIRLNQFIKRYIAGEPFADCLIAKQPNFLSNIKAGEYPLEKARIFAERYNSDTIQIKNLYMCEAEQKATVQKGAADLLNSILALTLRTYFKEQIEIEDRNSQPLIQPAC